MTDIRGGITSAMAAVSAATGFNRGKVKYARKVLPMKKVIQMSNDCIAEVRTLHNLRTGRRVEMLCQDVGAFPPNFSRFYGLIEGDHGTIRIALQDVKTKVEAFAAFEDWLARCQAEFEKRDKEAQAKGASEQPGPSLETPPPQASAASDAQQEKA